MNNGITLINSLINRAVNNSRVRYVLQQRIMLALGLLVIQLQFFTANLLNSLLRAPTAGWELRIPIIDDNLTPLGYWLIPYTAGFFLAALVPLWAMVVMPNTQYRQFVFGMAFAALVGYVIYIVFPTYVTKPALEQVPGSDIFAQILRDSYAVDAKISTHNAAPSQHVFYAVLNMCFVLNYRPRPRTFWLWTTLAALISASALLTMRHNSPDIILGYVTAVIAYYVGLWLGAQVTRALGDADDPIRLPVWIPPWLLRWLSGDWRKPRPAHDLDTTVL